jgi:AcrR family transcriptional regulator
MSAPVRETRRERQRREVVADICAAARRRLAEHGARGVSVRAIAQDVGLSPASLYTYVTGIDDIFTLVVLEGFRSLSSYVEAALDKFAGAGAGAAERCVVGVLAYRQWAVDNPGQFNLVFTDQISGYRAPPDGPTVAALQAVFDPLIDALADGFVGSSASSDPAARRALATERGIELWFDFHGFVSLEVNHHLPFIADPAGRLTQMISTRLVALGLDQPEPTILTQFRRWASRHPATQL